jgi:hypothetical protein
MLQGMKILGNEFFCVLQLDLKFSVFREPEFVAFHKKPQILLIGKVSEPEVH